MTNLSTGSGSSLNIGSGNATRISSAVAGSNIVFGNGGTHVASPYQAYLGMWSTTIANNSNMIYSVSLATLSATFPSNTTFEWSIVPDARYGGVEGYLTLSYGNYDDNAVSITPRQVKNISSMSLNVEWAYSGTNTSGLLSECYLTTTSHTTGTVSGADPIAEVSFFPHCSPNAKTFAAGLTPVGSGSFTDSNGVTWNVGRGTSGIPTACPYFVATRVGYVDHQGVLDFKSLFTFLTTSGAITGNEYFNGVAFGVEPYGRGSSQLTINSFTSVYS